MTFIGRPLAVALIICFFTHPVVGLHSDRFEGSFYKTTYSLDATGNCFVSTNIYVSTFTETIRIPVAAPQHLRAYDLDGPLEFILENNSVQVRPRIDQNITLVTVEYLTAHLTRKTKSTWEFNHDIAGLDTFATVVATIVLPPQATLISHAQSTSISTEQNRLHLTRLYDLTSSNQTLAVSARYELPVSAQQPTAASEEASTPTHNPSIPVIPLIVLGFVLIAVFAASRIDWHELSERLHARLKGDLVLSDRQASILKTLSDHEQEVLRLLLAEKDGRLTQKDIFHQSGIPKSSLSRLLRDLESRNIVEIRDIGYTNLVILQDWFKNK